MDQFHLVQAGEFLKQQRADTFDFVFMDSERKEYIGWWNDLQRILISGDCWLRIMQPRMRKSWKSSSDWFGKLRLYHFRCPVGQWRAVDFEANVMYGQVIG
jgi:hypothetical protein